MSGFVGQDDFQLRRALRDAVALAPVKTDEGAHLRFYLAKPMPADAIMNWCAELERALGTVVRFSAGGSPDQQVEGAKFQINVHTPGKPGLSPHDIAGNALFRDFVKKQLTFASQQILAIADKHSQVTFRNGDMEQEDTHSVSFRKSEPQPFDGPMRLSALRNIESAAMHLVMVLGREKNNELFLTVDRFSKLVRAAVTKAGNDDSVNLGLEEKQELYRLATRLRDVQMQLLMFQNTFGMAAQCFDGWNPTTKPEAQSPQTPRKPGP